MASSESERISCPSCGKTYRWKPALANRKVACQACQTQFTFPDQPVAEKPSQAAEPAGPETDDGLYELASDPEAQIDLPPAHTVPKNGPAADAPAPSASTEPGQASEPTQPIGPNASSDSDAADPPGESGEQPSGGEPIMHISEAKKAARREEQRKAAAQAESVRTWRDYKLLYILLGVFLLLALIYLAMYLFSEAMEDGLHKTMRPDSHTTLVAYAEPF